MEMAGVKERLQTDEKECNEAETNRTSDEEEDENDSEGATLLWQEGYNEDNEGLPIMHWEALSLHIAELEKQEEARREKNAKVGGSPDNSWMDYRATRAENWDYEDDSCNSHVMALTSRLQTQMNLQLCFINNSESEDEEDKEEGSSKKNATNNRIISDAKLRLLNVVARWPGSTHDSFIFHNSSVGRRLQDGALRGRSYLLGDKGYPLLDYLITPLANAHGEQEQRFNQAHIKTRATVERCAGLLKGRWMCLGHAGGTLLYSPEKVCHIILACSVLHNIAEDNGIFYSFGLL